MHKKNSKKLNKYALDSSAAFYPYFTTRKTQSMFCVGAVLDGDIDKQTLCVALNDVMDRFPLYKTRLKKGYGAYYLNENTAPVEVFDLTDKVLAPIDTRKTNGYQFRLMCAGKRVKLEMFHALTDANGAMKFLLAVLRRYRELQGAEFPADCTAVACDSPVPDGELENAFKKYYVPIPFSELNLKGMAGEVPHRTQGTLRKNGYVLEEGSAKTAQMLQTAKAMGVSFTAYLAGAVAYSIVKSAQVKRPIVMMVPVNLRKLFPSDTTSNFVTFVRVVIKRDECKTLDECVKNCAKQLVEKASKEKMSAFISTTVRAQRNIIFRAVPLALKWFFMRLGRLFMKSRQTIIISNLGSVTVPDEMGVEALTLNLNVSKNNVQNLGTVSCGGDTRLTFTSAIEENDFPNAFWETLREQGINITKSQV